MHLVEAAHAARFYSTAVKGAIEMLLLCTRRRLLRPGLRLNRERGRLGPGPPVVQRQRDMNHLGEERNEAQG